MNYTKNYHLPQWDETDRILRTDFNQMCADMEKGLTENRDDAQAGISGSREKEEILDRRLLRLMYNHYCAVKNVTPFPRQMGIFHQKPAAGSGSMLRDGVVYMVNADQRPDIIATEMEDVVTRVQEMQIVKNDLASCKPQIISFSTPAPGMITSLKYVRYHDNKTVDAVPVRLLIELKNLDTEKVDWSKRLTVQMEKDHPAIADTINFNIPFHGGYRYHLIMTPLTAPVNGQVGFQIGENNAGYMRFFSGAPGGSFTQSYYNFEECTEGVVILRCKSGGAGGKVTFRWNGEVMGPTKVREIPVEDGWFTQEYFFCRKNTPKENEFSVDFQCNKNGEFWFYDWGGIFC